MIVLWLVWPSVLEPPPASSYELVFACYGSQAPKAVGDLSERR